jgi:superfamily II DNA or RNA helicase
LITLRPYQLDGERRIREAYSSGARAPLYVLPCGGGKTVTFASIAHSAAKRLKRVLILCHRIELVDQIVMTLAGFGVTPDIIAAAYQRSKGRYRATDNAVAVASVQTLVRRLDSYPAPTLIIIDECHHVVAGSWATILRAYPQAKVLGVTASPIRGDGRGLGNYFDRIIVGPSVKELTEQGYLARARVFAPPIVDTSGLHVRMGDYIEAETEALMDKPSITGDALGHYRQHTNGLPALAFCTSVRHAHHVAERFRKEGYSAVALDGGTDKELRRMAVRDFRDGKIQLISQCEIACEGWDLPGVHCGLFLRPTQSLALWIQMTGRCSRPAPGKEFAYMLDAVGNTLKLGLPSDDRNWELTLDSERAPRPAIPGIRVCPKCFAASSARALICVECGTAFETKPRQDLAEKEGELVELTPEELERKKDRMKVGMAKTLEQLEHIAMIRGYKPGWARIQWEMKKRKFRKKETA